jgi:hypothetical protein
MDSDYPFGISKLYKYGKSKNWQCHWQVKNEKKQNVDKYYTEHFMVRLHETH